MSQRAVTEQDFRMPEFRTAKPEDYEFRGDGKVVRKDRWEMAVQAIRISVGLDAREFEIDDVVAKVRAMADVDGDWMEYEDGNYYEMSERTDVQLKDGSILVNLYFDAGVLFWNPGSNSPISIACEHIQAWREHKEIPKKV